MTNNSKKDPVDVKLGPQKEQAAVKSAQKAFDIGRLSIGDFKAIPREAARSPHPFYGYPKRLIDVPEASNSERTFKVNLTYIVAINPTKVQVHQDPSGRNISYTDPRTGNEIKHTIRTTHNRVVVDYEAGGQNIDVDFGREITLSDGSKLMCAIVPSHSARAQLCFVYDAKTQRIKEDERYLLPDLDQVGRLRRVFEMIINPKIKTERWAASITGESGEDLDELAVNVDLPDAEG